MRRACKARKARKGTFGMGCLRQQTDYTDKTFIREERKGHEEKNHLTADGRRQTQTRITS
jgi:hypothetical protein